MYRKKSTAEVNQYQVVCVEDLVPQNHLLRQINRAIDFSFIYDEVKGLYKEREWGKPGIDPVSLFKIVFIQYLYGIPSMRRTIAEIQVNVAYRWFIGYGLTEPVPHFSTFGKNYSRRFAGTDVFERIFSRILDEAVRCGFVDPEAIFIDGTHIRANANLKKATKASVTVEAKRYQKQLDEEVAQDRAAHGKKPLKNERDGGDGDGDGEAGKAGGSGGETKIVTKSPTDPDCGLFCKGQHEKQMAYVSNAACDKHGFVLAAEVAAGNVHDSLMFDGVYEKAKARFPEITIVAADSAYRTPWIAKQVLEDGRILLCPYKRPMTPEGYFKKREYIYDPATDTVRCPNDQVLHFSTTNREGYREYKSDPAICKDCPCREQCTKSISCQKTVTRHIWEHHLEVVEALRREPSMRAVYAKRKETIERVFADAKVKHGMRFTQMRGLAKVTMQVLLTFACMNLKKLAKWKAKNGLLPPFFSLLFCFFQKTWKVEQNPAAA